MLKDRVLRGLHVAIVDEVDSILVDESRTPLIISGGAKKNSKTYIYKARCLCETLKKATIMKIDEKNTSDHAE